MQSNNRLQADLLWEQGNQCLQEGDIQNGVNFLAQAITLYEHIGALKEAAEGADALATLLSRYGALQEALTFSKRSLALEKWRGNIQGTAISLANLGTLHLITGNVAEALSCQQEALSLFRTLGDLSGEVQALFNLGNIYSEMSDHGNAVANYEQVVIASKALELGGPILIAALSSLGAIYGLEGDLEKAVSALEEALNYMNNLSKQGRASFILMDGEGQADPEKTLLENLILICVQQRDFSKAKMYCNRGLAKHRSINNESGIARFTELLGFIHLEMGEVDQALEFTENAVQLIRHGFNNTADLARSVGQLARIYHLSGDTSHAISSYEEALSMARSVSDPALYSKLKGNMGLLNLDLGRFNEALQCGEEALQFARKVGSKSSEANQLANLGLVYQQMNDFPTAFDYLEAALRIQQDIGDEHGQAIQLGNIGQIALQLSNTQAAIRYFTRALDINIKLGLKQGEAVELGNLGMAYMVLEDYEQAMNYLQQAAECARQLGDQHRETIQLLHLGNVYSRLERYSDALTTLTRAITLAETNGDPSLVYFSRHQRGVLNQYLGQIDNAYTDWKVSIDNWEFLRRQITSEQQKFTFVDLKRGIVYTRLIALLYDNLRRYEEAYEYVRRAKSQAFTDRVGHLSLSPPPEVPQELQQVEQRLMRKLQIIEKNLSNVGSMSERHRTWIELERTQQELEQVISKIGTFAPDYAEWRQARFLKLDQIHTIINSQDKQVTLVEFFVLPEKILMFVLCTGDPHLHTLEVQIDMSRLAYVLRAFDREIVEYHPDRALKETWLTISQELIQPLWPYLDGCELLCFVPHMHLHPLPLHALMVNGKRLIEYLPIVYLPTSRLLERWQGRLKHRNGRCLALGYTPHDSEKTIFEEEAKRVAALSNGKAYISEKATSSVVRDEAKWYSYLHFSCHGHFEEKVILNSGLDLADGRFTIKDIIGLSLNANLIVLSACQTGANLITAGDDLVGLTRSFLSTGSDTLLVSLWSVHGESTFQFMETFYEHLKAGIDKARALQLASLELMTNSEFNHPYHWAPFALIGDWR